MKFFFRHQYHQCWKIEQLADTNLKWKFIHLTRKSILIGQNSHPIREWDRSGLTWFAQTELFCFFVEKSNTFNNSYFAISIFVNFIKQRIEIRPKFYKFSFIQFIWSGLIIVESVKIMLLKNMLLAPTQKTIFTDHLKITESLLTIELWKSVMRLELSLILPWATM